jgi:tRNA-modifying protein YgfZ
MTTILRPSRAVFRFSGPDAQKLLNDVVTGTIEAVEGPAAWWALLSPQGKIQAEGLSGFAGGAFWFDVHEGVADAFFRRMRMYKLRAQMEIEDLRASHMVGWSDEDGVPGLVHEDARGIGRRFIVPRDAVPGLPMDEAPFITARIAAGVAEMGPDFEPDTTFPHDIGMDLLQGVDFKKGCYVGQEVVSRMQHRGTARRRPVIVSAEAAASGMPVLAGGREAGSLGAVVDGTGVAILRLDRIEDTGAVTVDETSANVSLPAWATYSFGESGSAE